MRRNKITIIFSPSYQTIISFSLYFSGFVVFLQTKLWNVSLLNQWKPWYMILDKTWEVCQPGILWWERLAPLYIDLLAKVVTNSALSARAATATFLALQMYASASLNSKEAMVYVATLENVWIVCLLPAVPFWNSNSVPPTVAQVKVTLVFSVISVVAVEASSVGALGTAEKVKCWINSLKRWEQTTIFRLRPKHVSLNSHLKRMMTVTQHLFKTASLKD